jgi:predicted nuclease of predicted toxin-antitoxin system
MKLKLDENLDERLADRIARAGHDASTVRRQGLGGAKDEILHRVCREEGRTLVTLDLDFASVIRFPSEDTEGIIVLRPRSPLVHVVRDLIDTLVTLLETRSPAGQFWVVEPGRVRIRLGEMDDVR